MPSLPSVVRRTCERWELFAPGARVLAAVSGGPDSTAMLYVLVELGPSLGISLGVAHFHHHIRGDQADADAAFVSRLAGALGLPLHAGGEDVPARARVQRMSLEQAAREARYSFLRETAQTHGYGRIAVGHTLDDQAETVLLAMLRGAGLDGLGGMAPLAADLARPLIEATRDQVLEYLRVRGLDYRTDESNLDLRYTRNRVRHLLIPFIEGEFCPHLKAALARQAQLLRDEGRWVGRLTGDFLETAAKPVPGGLAIDLERLQVADIALRRRAVREAARIVSGQEAGPLRFANVEDVLGLLEARTGATCDLPAGLRARRDYGCLEVVRRPGADPKDTGAGGEPSGGILLPVPGQATSGDGRWRLALSIVDRVPPGERRWRLTPERDGCTFRAVLDYGRLNQPLLARRRRPGDRFWPHGAPGEKKLQDFLTDLRVPRAQRDRLPLVEDGAGRVAAVLPLRAAHWATVDDQSEKVLVIEGQITEVPFLAKSQ